MNRYLVFIPDESVMATLVFTVVASSKAKAISDVRSFYEREYSEKAPAAQDLVVRVVPKSEEVVQLTNLHTTYKRVEVEREYKYTPQVEWA